MRSGSILLAKSSSKNTPADEKADDICHEWEENC